MQPASKTCNVDEYTLHVNDLPAELDWDGINRVFSKFGSIKSVIALDDLPFAFVSYSTFAEAEAAINALDNKPPLFLKVNFRKQKGQDVTNENLTNGEKSLVNKNEITYDFRYSKPTLPNCSSIPNADHTKMKLPENVLSARQYSMDPNGYIPNPDLVAYNPYDDLDYASANAMWSRGFLSIDEAGRHVTMGRGHTFYHIPYPYPMIQKHIGNVYERRHPGFYRYDEDQAKCQIGKCMLCLRDAIYVCSSCDGYYCSDKCQTTDWPKHKNDCKKFPPLAYAKSNVSHPSMATTMKNNLQSESTNSSQHDTNDTQHIPPKSVMRSQSTPCENKNPSSNVQRSISHNDTCNGKSVDTATNNNDNSKNNVPFKLRKPSQETLRKLLASLENNDTCNGKSVDTATNNNDNSKNNVPFKLRKPSQETLRKPLLSLETRLQNARRENIKSFENESDFVFQRPTFLPKTDFIEVEIIEVIKPGLYCVQKNSDLDQIQELMKKLNSIARNLPLASKIVVGNIYAVVYSEIWHRALVLSENPLKIDYIDYGTIEEVKDVEFRELGELVEIPRFSRIIKLSPRAMMQWNSLSEACHISVKMIDINSDGTINVDVLDREEEISKNCGISQVDNAEKKSEATIQLTEPEVIPMTVIQQEQQPIESKDECPPSILNLVAAGMDKIGATIGEKIDDYSATAVLLFNECEKDYEKLIEPLKDDCNAMEVQYKNFCPQLNDLVCAKQSDGYWIRGRVLDVSTPLKIASLDEGIIRQVNQTIPIPSQYNRIPIFAVTITTTCKFPGDPEKVIPIKILNEVTLTDKTSSQKGIVQGEFIGSGFEGIQVEIKEWTVLAEDNTKKQKLLIGMELNNNSKVIIQSHRGPSIVFVRSLDQKNLELQDRLTQDVAKAAELAKSLTSLPVCGDLVLAKYIDDNYYRAIVVSTLDNDIEINYVDYGNMEVTKLEKLKEMPDIMKELPRTSARVNLKGIKMVPPSKDADDYLSCVAANETPFICTFDETIDNGVTLTSIKGECLNDIINDLLSPSYEQENKSVNQTNEKYFQLGDMEMGKLGNIGDVAEAYFLATLEPGFKYVFAPIDRELINYYLFHELPKLLEKYCATVSKYIPRRNEVCIAKFEDGWYRGCCSNPSATPTSAEIYFVDYGNVSQVDHQDIRIMPEDFLKPAVLGCVSKITGIEPSSDNTSPKLLKRLDDLLIPNESEKIKILKYDEGEWTIELPTIQKTLIDEGIISK